MRSAKVSLLVGILMLGIFAWLVFWAGRQDTAFAQQPTVAIATVTGTPAGTMITVNMDQDHVNVRAGP